MAKKDMASVFGLSYLSKREKQEAPRKLEDLTQWVSQTSVPTPPWLEHAYLEIGSVIMRQLRERDDGCIRLHALINEFDTDENFPMEVDIELMFSVAERLSRQNLIEYTKDDKLGNYLLCLADDPYA